jgi:hypothetical protein
MKIMQIYENETSIMVQLEPNSQQVRAILCKWREEAVRCLGMDVPSTTNNDCGFHVTLAYKVASMKGSEIEAATILFIEKANCYLSQVKEVLLKFPTLCTFESMSSFEAVCQDGCGYVEQTESMG